MANVFNGHQAIIDTPGAGTIWPANLKITGGVWEGMTAPSSLTILDLSGATFTWQAYATNYPISIDKIGWLHGLIVPTLGSGRLYLFLDK